MSTVTAVKIAPSEQENLTLGELRAWRSQGPRIDKGPQDHLLLVTQCFGLFEQHPCAGYQRLRPRYLNGRQARLSRSGLTRLVDRLERDGLLERCSCSHDARGSYACLTDGGRERLAEARGTHLAVIREQFFSHFSESELSSLADMWERIAPCTVTDVVPADS